jgi:hypothetical protein
MTFLPQLLRRASMVSLIVASLLVLAVFYNFYARGKSAEEFETYIPSARVAQHRAIAKVFVSPDESQVEGAVKFGFPECSDRQLELLKNQLAKLPSSSSYGVKEDLIARAYEGMNSYRRANCREFVFAVDRVLRILSLSQNKLHVDTVDRLIVQSLTEDVAWLRSLPCLYGRPSAQPSLIRGPLSACYREGVALSVDASLISIKRLAGIAYQRYVNEPAIKQPLLRRSAVLLQLDPHIQQVLNDIADCFRQSSNCHPKIRPLLTDLQGATVVVTNPSNGGILGLLCVGPKCTKNDLEQFDHYAALMLEAPMASTAKLFYALAFAQDSKVSHRELELQIKTSGQLDPLALKRNEWWEKTAICDSSSQADCRRAARAQQTATDLFFNIACNPLKDSCGRIGVMPRESRHFASMGRFAALTDMAAYRSKTPFIPWVAYDSIRQGKLSASKFDSVSYSNTSSAVQSVIGSGDNRISALGLAMLSANVYQLSRGSGPRRPNLLVDIDQASHGGDLLVSSSLRRAATVVYSGMTRAMVSSEPGWTGDGTGHRAFLEAFERSCGTDCAIAGKTGTVTLKDPNFPGTTLFTSVANLGELGRGPDHSQDEPNLIALGVIAFPVDPSRVNSGHLASRLALRIVRVLVDGL